MEQVLIALAVIGGTGLLIGVLLGIAGKLLEVKVDEREVKVRECLPGNNCGGCGYAGCDGLAKAIANGEAPVNGCPVGGAEAAAAIGKIMGASASVEKKVAVVRCNGDCTKAKEKFNYIGNMSCGEAINVGGGGSKACAYGCLGLGSCVQVCEFGALSIKDGIAYVDKEKCVACGKCVKACPKNLIEIIPYINEEYVKCSSKDPGKEVRLYCSGGCIGCKLCEKNCPVDAITVIDNLAHIDYDKCVVCGICKEKCPSKCIN